MRVTKPASEIVTSPAIGVPDAPGGALASMPSGKPQVFDLKADPSQEYVAGGYYGPLGNYVRTLPEWVDPVQRDFGLDIYLRMVQCDPQVASCIEVYKSAVLADGWRISPAQDTDELLPPKAGKPARNKSSDDAVEVAEFCKWALSSMSATPFELFLRQMLDASYQGHKVAEIVLKVQQGGKWSGKLTLERLKPKPHRSTAFVMDAYDNLVGILGLLPNVPFYGMWPAFGFLAGSGLSLVPGAGKDQLQKDAPALLPRSKFAVLTWDGQDGSPQGRSLLRRAFTPWWWKEQGYGIWGRFITKHADPSLVGTVADQALPGPDPLGGTDPATGGPAQITPIGAMSRTLAGFQNGSYAAIPFGAKIEALEVSNNGEAISLFMDFCNKEIAKAILGQTLSTEEGKHASRAQAGVHEHSKDDVTRYGQVLLTGVVICDILALLVLQNWGPGSEHLIPEFGLGQEETMSYTDFASGTAALTTAGYLHESQYVGLDEMGGLPPRDEATWNAEMKAKNAAILSPPDPPAPPIAPLIKENPDA